MDCKAIRWACVLLCMFLFLALIYALIMMVLPELIRSVMNLIYSFPTYMKASQKWLQSVLEKWNLNSQALDTLDQYTLNAQNYLTQNILPQMQEMLKNISAGVFDLINFLKNFLIGAIVSLYLMADKEGFIAKAKMLTYGQYFLRSTRILSSVPCALPIRPLSAFSLEKYWIPPSSACCAILA